METVSRNASYDDVVYDRRQSKADVHKNDDRPHLNRSHRRHSSRHSIVDGNRLPSPATPNCDTTRRESLTTSSARENLTSASPMSHRRQTIGGKLGFIAFEDTLGDVISLCPQMTSWLNDSLDNVVCVNCDLDSSKEKALPAFYYTDTLTMGGGSKSRPSTVSLSLDRDRRKDEGPSPSQRSTPSGRRSRKLKTPPDDNYKCFARSPSSLRVIYEPDFNDIY